MSPYTFFFCALEIVALLVVLVAELVAHGREALVGSPQPVQDRWRWASVTIGAAAAVVGSLATLATAPVSAPTVHPRFLEPDGGTMVTITVDGLGDAYYTFDPDDPDSYVRFEGPFEASGPCTIWTRTGFLFMWIREREYALALRDDAQGNEDHGGFGVGAEPASTLRGDAFGDLSHLVSAAYSPDEESLPEGLPYGWGGQRWRQSKLHDRRHKPRRAREYDYLQLHC